MPSVLKPFARRLVPARGDLAASHLAGEVRAERFAAGVPRCVQAPLLDLTLTPCPNAERATQLLHGEAFILYEERADGLGWGQAERDGYVGFVALAGLGPARINNRIVSALGSHIYSGRDIKSRPTGRLPFLARVAVAGTTGDFARLRGGGHVPLAHLAPIAGDLVTQAERFLGVPYLWGGRSLLGIDCSALVQLAALAVGLDAPRDSDMQAALLGEPLARGAAPARGDLLFWKGHVGILADPETLIHANAHHMAVAKEPLAMAIRRIRASGGGNVIARRRLPSAGNV